MAELDLDSILNSVVPATEARERTWRRFGFLRNPYPSRSHPVWDVFYNQTEVRTRFLRNLQEFLREGITVTLFFTGGNRVGKTHFMEHHRRELTEKFRSTGILLPIAVTTAQSCDFRTLYGQLIDQIDESLRIQTGLRLFEANIPEEVRNALDSLPPGDFKRAVVATAAGGDKLLLRRWLRGERIRAPQRALLGVSSPIESASQMLNALEGLIKFMRLPGEVVGEEARCRGLLVFLDEFELIWKARRDRRDQFLQALRALIDSAPSGMFLCVGMATGINVEMEEVEASYPALFARLKGAMGVPALVQIGFVTEAIGYVRAFEDHARADFKQETKATGPYEEIFSDQEIESLFKELAGRGSVSQGDFFDRLHTEAERRVRPEVADDEGQ
jgi:P-loop Domain of unknown function (DUF2791)